MELKSSETLVKKRPVLEKLLKRLLAKYEYASILAQDSKTKEFNIKNSGASVAQTAQDYGYDIKVYDGESYGEYSTNMLEEERLDEIMETIDCCLIPWKETLPNGQKVISYETMKDEKISFVKATQYEKDPADYTDNEMIELLTELRKKTLKSYDKIFDARVLYRYSTVHKIFMSPNKNLEQNILFSDAVLFALAYKGEEVKYTIHSAGGLKGVEAIEELEGQIPKIKKRLEAVLKSKPMIPGEYEVVCDPGVTGLIVHEAFGHGVEMDMFVKDRALAKEFVGDYVASPLITMHDGAAAPRSMKASATFFFDDEGVISQDTIIIDKGILKTGICDVQAAMGLNLKPTGNGRRERPNHKAYTRMTNTYFEPGEDSVEDMIKSIDYGFYVAGDEDGMEDPKNWGIQCQAAVALEIKDGKFTGNSFSPVTITGYVPDLLKSISMVSKEFEISSAGYCGKGYKEWVKVSCGGPYIKTRMRLG